MQKLISIKQNECTFSPRSQTVRCIYLIFEMFQLKRKDSFQSLAGLISPPAAAQGMKSGTLKLFKVDIGWRIKSLNQSPIFRVRAERIKHHLGQKFVNLWWGPRRIKRREKQFVLLRPQGGFIFSQN